MKVAWRWFLIEENAVNNQECVTRVEKLRDSSLELEVQFKEERDEREQVEEQSFVICGVERSGWRNLDVIVSVNSGTHRKVWRHKKVQFGKISGFLVEDWWRSQEWIA